MNPKTNPSQLNVPRAKISSLAPSFKPKGSFRNFRNNNKNSMRGFSLIELMVVIGIVGILVTLAVQALSDSKSSSIESQVRGALKSLNLAQTRAFLIGDPGRPNAVDSAWVNDPESAVQWYVDNGYLNLPEFDQNVLNYIEIRPLTPIEIAANHDPVNIWKRKP